MSSLFSRIADALGFSAKQSFAKITANGRTEYLINGVSVTQEEYEARNPDQIQIVIEPIVIETSEEDSYDFEFTTPNGTQIQASGLTPEEALQLAKRWGQL
jgi:hypothetical protein